MKTIFFIFCLSYSIASAQQTNKFEPLGTLLPTPNEYRTAGGAPGPKYWQQQVDYNIKCSLNEKDLRITGFETITYHNNSPGELTYLWLSLDENIYSKDRNANYQYNNAVPQPLTQNEIDKWEKDLQPNDYGVNITAVTDNAGKKIKYTINRTMMRIDLPAPLKSEQQYILKIAWNYKLTNRMEYYGRGGYEHFADDGNNLYTVTHWYPRLCLYSDYGGWHNQQYSNKEFALSFGNFTVSIDVPADHVVGATGECQNYQQVLSADQLSRLQKARDATKPIDIISLNEAKQNEQSRSTARKTWTFKAANVRDFAWTSSRKFAWDAMTLNLTGKNILCMSYYGKEAYPVYHEYSTNLIAHTLKQYSTFAFPYPYPVAQSVEASNGIEFPMICFNYGRVQNDGAVTPELQESVKHVVIHEVGHNFFPMIVSTDERQWAWMDEGFDTYLGMRAEKAWDSLHGLQHHNPSAKKWPNEKIEAIMTYPDNALHYSQSSYFKPATALNVLRETIMGHDRFDTAFKVYANRWAFKNPTPADFFRTMEDASADDLDWFWRGWFYGNDLCDIAIDTVKFFEGGESKYFYQVEMTNKGGLVMPVILKFNFVDGTSETENIPAQVWRYNEVKLTKSYLKHKKVISIQLDPNQETTDVDFSNNSFNF